MGACRSVTPSQEGAEAPHRPSPVQAPGSLTRERWPRRARLARGSDVRACWDTGHRHRTSHLELAWRPSPVNHPRIAIIVPRFHFNAVTRNRLRRRLREILRRGHLPHLPPVDAVVRARRGAYAARYAALRDEIADLVSRIT